MLEQDAPCGARVPVGALLARSTAAASVAAVIEEEEVEAGLGEQPGVVEPIADVAAVSVAEEDVALRGGGGAYPPAVEALAVLGLDGELPSFEVEVRRLGR